jgi:formylglycine-generating enzyme required for sulfatase activity
MGNQDAIESVSIGHGIFTMSLLDSYEHRPENRYSTVADIIAFTKTDVPDKFTALMEAASRGINVIDITVPETQKPMAHMPAENFEVFDRYTEPGTVTIWNLSAGKLSVFGLPEESVAIAANSNMQKQLSEGTYQFTMEYADGHVETKEVTVRNDSKKIRHLNIARFDYRIRPAVVAAAPVQPAPPLTPAAQPAAPPPERPVVPDMVRIPGGTFTMGSPAGEPEPSNDNEGPQHRVTVSSFYLGKYEVTQKEYQDAAGKNPSDVTGDNLPVSRVSWYDVIEFCNILSRKEGLTPAYTINKSRTDPNNTGSTDNIKWSVTWNRNATGYRLPTEAEWEYACRAGTTTAYNTGAKITDNLGWYKENSGDKVHPVGQKPANAWGLHDMHGNVYEWCWDWYGNYANGTQTDPTGPVSGATRVYRSGGWGDRAEYSRSAYRSKFGVPTHINKYIGFRVARTRE